MNRERTLPLGDEKRAAVESMFDRIAPRYERVNRVISLGLDRAWRRRALTELALPPSSVVLDVACGTGDLCRELRGSGLHPIGLDLSAGMLAVARTDAPLVRADVLTLPVADDRVDGVTCGFALRNFTEIAPFFAECARVLRPRGRLVVLDAAEPRGRLARLGHDLWFRRVVPRLGAMLSDGAAYRYLPASTAYLPPPSELAALLRDSGFSEVRRTTMTGGAVQLLSGTLR